MLGAGDGAIAAGAAGADVVAVDAVARDAGAAGADVVAMDAVARDAGAADGGANRLFNIKRKSAGAGVWEFAAWAFPFGDSGACAGRRDTVLSVSSLRAMRNSQCSLLESNPVAICASAPNA